MFSNDNNVDIIYKLIKSLKHYLGLQVEYTKLDIVEKIVRLLTIFTIIIVFIAIMAIIVLLLTSVLINIVKYFIGSYIISCLLIALFLSLIHI